MQERWSCPNCGCANTVERTACRKCKFEPVGLSGASPSGAINRPVRRNAGTLGDIGGGIAIGLIVGFTALFILLLYILANFRFPLPNTS